MTYEEIITIDFSYEKMLDMLRNGERFDFSKIGDGEANCIMQDTKRKENSDLHTYFPDLGGELLDVIKSAPNYYFALQNLAYRQRQSFFDEMTRRYNIKWCPADFLHRQNYTVGIQDLFDVLRERKVVVVGPAHISKINGYFPVKTFIEVPSVNAWSEHQTICDKIVQSITRDAVVLYCCGMMTSVLVNELQGTCTQIHVGSVFDPYCGVNSRGYHFRMEAGKGNEPSDYFKSIPNYFK